MSDYTVVQFDSEDCHSVVTNPVMSFMEATRSAILRRKNGNSWRGLGKDIDVPHGILHAIGTGSYEHVSWDTVRKVRVRLGLDDPGAIVSALACPDCGAAHTGRCYNKNVVSVVVLSEHERVTRAGKPRKRKPSKALRLPPDLWAALNAERNGQTWASYIEQLAIDARTLRAMEQGA